MPLIAAETTVSFVDCRKSLAPSRANAAVGILSTDFTDPERQRLRILAFEALVTRFTVPRLDKPLLDAIIRSGLVPPCAMTVQRTAEMGPFQPYQPPAACGCHFEATVPGGQARRAARSATGRRIAPGDRPACNNGYCEAQEPDRRAARFGVLPVSSRWRRC